MIDATKFDIVKIHQSIVYYSTAKADIEIIVNNQTYEIYANRFTYTLVFGHDHLAVLQTSDNQYILMKQPKGCNDNNIFRTFLTSRVLKCLPSSDIILPVIVIKLVWHNSLEI